MNRPAQHLDQDEEIEISIRDEDPSTEGGPPGWFAWSTVAGSFLIIALVVTLIWAIFTIA